MHAALVEPEQVDDFIILGVRAFASKVQRAMVRDVLKKENLPVLEWQLLFSVARFGSCHLAYITRRTSIDPAHGSRAVTALEAKGLISRCDDPNNRRRKLLSLTDDGVELFERIWPRARRMVKTATDQLDRRDFDELRRLLKLINEAAEPLRGAAHEDTEGDPITMETGKIAASA